MKRHKVVPPAPFPRNTDIPDDAADSTASHEYPRTLTPHAIQLREEMLVIGEMAHLIAVTRRVFFQRPIGRRSHHEMDGGVPYPGQVASVAESKVMGGALVRF